VWASCTIPFTLAREVAMSQLLLMVLNNMPCVDSPYNKYSTIIISRMRGWYNKLHAHLGTNEVPRALLVFLLVGTQIWE
jgi:hypothetical protein